MAIIRICTFNIIAENLSLTGQDIGIKKKKGRLTLKPSISLFEPAYIFDARGLV